jgi:hypothetical protein
VRRLELRRLRFSVDTVDRVFCSPQLSNLRELDLGYMQLSRAAADALARASFTGLEVMRLSGARLDARCMEALGRAPFASTLRVLELAKSTIDDDVLAVLGTAPFRSLETLDLGECKIGERGGRALADSKTLPRLARVDITKVRSPGARAAIEKRFARVGR